MTRDEWDKLTPDEQWQTYAWLYDALPKPWKTQGEMIWMTTNDHTFGPDFQSGIAGTAPINYHDPKSCPHYKFYNAGHTEDKKP